MLSESSKSLEESFESEMKF